MAGTTAKSPRNSAKAGKVEFIVWPGGDKSKETTVTVQIDPIGRFSPTWPYDCERSDKLMLELCEFLHNEHKREGGFGQPHTSSAAILALMGSNQRKYERLAFDIVRGFSVKRYDPLNGTGYQAWNWGHEGILLGEYYLLTKGRRVLPSIDSLVKCVVDAQTPESGGFSHRSAPYIMRRVAAGGAKGYGAMSLPGGLIMTALSLYKEAGLDHGDEAYERIHQAYLRSVDGAGGIGYGFNGLDHAVITLTGPNAKKSNSCRGIGFIIESGMTDIGPYEIEWPTKSDPRYRDTSWLQRETATNRVFDFGEAKRLVVRTQNADEPQFQTLHRPQTQARLLRELSLRQILRQPQIAPSDRAPLREPDSRIPPATRAPGRPAQSPTTASPPPRLPIAPPCASTPPPAPPAQPA